MPRRGRRLRQGPRARGRRAARRLAALLLAAALAVAAWLGDALAPVAGTPGLPATGQAEAPAAGGTRDLTPTTWDASLYPEYYRVAGVAVADEDVSPGEVVYSPLDELGRPGRAVARVTYELMESGSARERGDMGDLRPAGWGHNAQVDIPMPDGGTYHGYLFNRSHLIAKSLGGQEVLENVVCGTRTQNVGDNHGGDGGMAYPETLARDWLRAHPDGTVYYEATPVYVGDELVPRSVVVDVLSSDGSLDLEVEVMNAAEGFVIDYRTGEFTGP